MGSIVLADTITRPTSMSGSKEITTEPPANIARPTAADGFQNIGLSVTRMSTASAEATRVHVMGPTIGPVRVGA